jgi:hypothetical protein
MFVRIQTILDGVSVISLDTFAYFEVLTASINNYNNTDNLRVNFTL